MSARGTLETRLAEAERKINDLMGQLARVDCLPAKPPAFHDDDQIPFFNNSGETIPAYAIMEVTGQHMVAGKSGRTLTVVKPTGNRKRCFLVNGPVDVPVAGGSNTGYGWARMHSPTSYALYDESSGTPAYGELWGPGTSWKLANTQSGFEVIGGSTGSAGAMRMLVKQLSVGNGYFFASGTGTALLGVFSTVCPLGSVASDPPGLATLVSNTVTIHSAGLYLVVKRCDITCTGPTAGQNGGDAIGRFWTTYGTGGVVSMSTAGLIEYGAGATDGITGLQSSGTDICTIGAGYLAGVRIA